MHYSYYPSLLVEGGLVDVIGNHIARIEVSGGGGGSYVAPKPVVEPLGGTITWDEAKQEIVIKY